MKSKLIISFLILFISYFSTSTASATSLIGSGSTFAGNFIDKCRVLYAQQSQNTITYSATGSGAGRNAFNNKLADFAVSDVPYGVSDKKPSEDFIYIPLVSGPVAIVYNLPEYKQRLKLSKEVLAKIFAGQITKWNDPQIAKLNIGKLPNSNIIVVYRSDGSGTSEVFTSYLKKVAPTIWTKDGSKDFKNAFPGTMSAYFQAVSGSTQVAFTQQMFKGSIAYNEVSYVRGMQSALIENEMGKFIGPTITSTSIFLSHLTFNQDGTANVDYLLKTNSSYNISTFSYAIVYSKPKQNASEIKDFFTFALSKCNKIDGYAPISGNALKIAKIQIAKITG
jgi:phosphate ABC transporter phosphate-binding protein